MTMTDHAGPFRRTLTGRATPADLAIVTRQRHAAKRARALRTLGARWVLHPDYNAAANAHHAPSNKRSMMLDIVATMARRAGRLP